MSSKGSTRELMRAVALVGLAAFGLHQLRYLIGYGAQSDRALAEQGHDYLVALLPELIGAAIVLVGATLVAGAMLGVHGRSRRLRYRGRWLACSAALLAIFTIQETVEGFVSTGHPSGLVALTANRGWVAVPLALLFGALVVGLLRALGRTEQSVAAALTRARSSPRAVRTLSLPPQPAPICAAGRTLAFGFARRPPPLPS